MVNNMVEIIETAEKVLRVHRVPFTPFRKFYNVYRIGLPVIRIKASSKMDAKRQAKGKVFWID